MSEFPKTLASRIPYLRKSGYKGYGLAVMVDILCAVLGGAAFGPDIRDTETSSARVSHFFGAIRIDRFRDPAAIRRDMDRMLSQLRATPVAEGAERVSTSPTRTCRRLPRTVEETV